MTNAADIAKGIAYYKPQQEVLLRLIRRYGPLSAGRFDRIFYKRQLWTKKNKHLFLGVDGDSFLLGGLSGSGSRDWWLDLLQRMMQAGAPIDTTRINGEIHYILTENK